MAGDFKSLDRKVVALAAALTGPMAKKRLGRVGRKLAPEVDHAVARTLGDQSMSGWRRADPIEIRGGSKVLSDNEVRIGAQRGSGGPLRVLQSGRNMGQAGAFAGPGVNRKTGATARTKAGQVRKVRAARAKRWNGYTKAKHTWDQAESRITGRAGEVIHQEIVEDALRATFGRG